MLWFFTNGSTASANACVPGVSYFARATPPTKTSNSGMTQVGGTRPVIA